MRCSKYSRGNGSRITTGLLVLLSAIIFVPAASAQDAVTPATATQSPVPVTLATNLQGIVVVDSPVPPAVQPAGVTGVKGVEIKGPAFLREPQFEKMLKKHLGVPLTDQSLSQLQRDILKYCKAHNHQVVDVITPEQDVVDGTVQIAVVVGRVDQITVTNEGHKWFSDSLILGQIRLKTNDVVLESRLNDNLNWLNANNYQSLEYDPFGGSFRSVTANLARGGDMQNNPKDIGKTDIGFQVQDRFPLRVFAGYQDEGMKVLGENQVFAGFNYANVFGLDQRLNYEYLTDTDSGKLREHVANYVIPLPWRQELSVMGAYANVNPDLSVISPGLSSLTEKGTYYQLSGRYSISLPSYRQFDHEIAIGYDFKRTDTPLLFSGSATTLQPNQIDIDQFTLTYSGRIRDGWGVSAFSLQGVYSPGDLTGFNNDADFNEMRAGTTARYAYGRAEFRRETYLSPVIGQTVAPSRFTWNLTAVGQLSDARLAPTEEFALGGYDTVRGYNERVLNADDGWLIRNEIRTPEFILGNLTGRQNKVDWIQGLIFCDYGRAITREPNPALLENYDETMLSVGAGLRYQMADNLCFRFNYGYQLKRGYATTALNAASLGSQPSSRVHLAVEISF